MYCTSHKSNSTHYNVQSVKGICYRQPAGCKHAPRTFTYHCNNAFNTHSQLRNYLYPLPPKLPISTPTQITYTHSHPNYLYPLPPKLPMSTPTQTTYTHSHPNYLYPLPPKLPISTPTQITHIHYHPHFLYPLPPKLPISTPTQITHTHSHPNPYLKYCEICHNHELCKNCRVLKPNIWMICHGSKLS
jgi:hypothetical protein